MNESPSKGAVLSPYNDKNDQSGDEDQRRTTILDLSSIPSQS